ncbi:MAG TPA: hypothetical protein VL947_10040 [Cytophagales bacterium]|nr:hypothetical protein [Cytophagales bacterium]
MKVASLSEIKKELKTLDAAQILELCMRMAKYKKENKELLHYLLFEAHDDASYVNSAKEEITGHFENLNAHTPFFAKKTIRKALRTTNKHIKYAGAKHIEVELLLHFCKTMKATGMPIHRYTVVNNLYNNQIKKIQKALGSLHEDVQGDFENDLKGLGII